MQENSMINDSERQRAFQWPGFRFGPICAAATLLLLGGSAARAADILWQAGTGDYNSPQDWVGGVTPGSADNAINDNGSNNIVEINANDPAWKVNDIRAGNGEGDGAWVQNGQTITLNGWFRLGIAAGNNGFYTLNGGTINYQGGDFNIGELGTGVLNIKGGTILGTGNFADNLGGSLNTDVVNQAAGFINITGNGQLFVGNNGVGIYNLSGGTNSVSNYIAFGRQGGTGTVNMTGGVLLQNGGGNLLVGTGYEAPAGGSAVGILNQSGGTINCVGNFLCPENSPSTGTYNLSTNGVLNCNNWIVFGRSGATGTLNISGGKITKSDGNGDHFDVGAGGPGTINQTGGMITNTTSDFWLGENASGTWNMSNSTNYLGVLILGDSGGGNGAFNLTDGVLNVDGIVVGNDVNTQGTVTQSGGTVNSVGSVNIPQQGDATTLGTYSLSGNSVLNCGDWLVIGRDGGAGVMNLTNGTITLTSGGNFDIGSGNLNGVQGQGTLNQYGGSIINTNDFSYVGESGGNGTWNMYGGTNILGVIQICENDSAVGTLNLSGGVIRCTEINTATALPNSVLNLNGGTIQAANSDTLFISGISTVTVGSSGVDFDSQNYNVTVVSALQDNGGGTVTKDGSGTVILAGANSYSGATTVNAGNLEVSTASSGSGPVTAADKAGFGTLTASANGQLNISSLSMGGATGGVLNFDLSNFGNPANAPLNVQGDFTASGTFTINVAASVVAPGTIPLVQFANIVGTPRFTIGSLPPGVLAHLAATANALELVVTSAGAPRWDGAVNGAWDLGTNQDWVDLGTLLPAAYSDGKPVTFDDNASGTTTVDLTATVSPASVNFTNFNLAYTLVGPGKIAGASGLIINGSAGVSILNIGGNTFTGPVVINAGTLSVTNLGNGGSPSPLGASSASPTNLVLNGGTLSYAGAPVKSNRGFLIAATNSTIDAEGNLTLGGQVTNIANPFEGEASAFAKTGPAQLTLTGSGDQEFSRGYQAGINVVAGTLVLDGSAGNQTNHTQNELWVGSTPNSGAALILTNTTLHVDSWLGLGRINGGINNTSSLALYNSSLTLGNLSVGWDGNQGGNLSSQFVTLNGNSTLTNYGAVNLPEGSGSTLLMSINGNSVFWVQNPVYLALAANSAATLVVSNSGQVVQSSGYFDIAQGPGSAASVLLKNNASVLTFSDFNLADTGSGATASFTAQDSSALHANNIYVGKAASSVGTLTISNSATVVSANGVSLTSGTGATGTVNLCGGSLSANLIQGTTDPTATSTFNFNGGTLVAHGPLVTPKFMFDLSAINILAGGAVIDTESNSITIAQPLLSGGGNGGFTKNGVGTLNLNGANTYLGTTLVNDGTLSGSGSIAGPVTIGADGAIEPGFLSIGTFTINNTLTFDADSSAFFKIGTTNYDEVAGLTHVTYGGSLIVTNTTGYPLVIGNTYHLFHSATAGVSNFTSVTILPNGVGIFNPTNGVLTIIPGGPLAIYPPVISGNELIFAGTGGTPGKTYSILTSTNLAAPLSTWTTNFTGVFDSSGVFSNGISIKTNDTGVAHVFRLKLP